MKVWYAIPSANPSQCGKAFAKWKAQGYRTAVLVNSDCEPIPNADVQHRVDAYRGWGWAVNELVKLPQLADADIVVTGGDDMFPDPVKNAATIGAEFVEHFAGTFGVMQPTGDPFDDIAHRGQCGSPWLGRDWIKRAYQGHGPLPECYYHYCTDTELYYVALKYGCLWMREDLTQEHRHWTRYTTQRPAYLVKAANQHNREQLLFADRAHKLFPGSEPLAATVAVQKSDVCCLVCPGRFGDILNLLPVAQAWTKQGRTVHFCIGTEYASMFDGVSYAKPIIWSGNFMDGAGAARYCKERLPGAAVFNCRVPGVKVGREYQYPSFVLESWAPTGEVEHWNEWPLVFDRRDAEREAKLIEELGVTADTLLFNGGGCTSPLPNTAWLLDLLREHWQHGPVLDLTDFRAHRIYDLLGVMERAAGLVTSDSSLLHLSYAAQCPVVAFIQDKPMLWGGPLPRNHWVDQVYYSAMLDSGERLKQALASMAHGAPVRQRQCHAW